MRSVFDTDGVEITRFFDVKGSILGRSRKEGESVEKDNDLRENGGFVFEGEGGEREKLIRVIRDDTMWLEGRGVIDYSLLIGVGQTLDEDEDEDGDEDGDEDED